ncbi:MAG: S8 family serine peptidase [Desulfurococcaceae archaeon]
MRRIFLLLLLVLSFSFSKEYVSDEVVVVLKKGQNFSVVAGKVANKVGGTVKKRRDEYVLIRLPQNVDVLSAVQTLKGMEEVYTADPNYIIRAFLTPNDPMFSSQWGLPKIQAPNAWNLTTGGSSVIVAVVDTGVDYNHPDINLNMWRNLGEICNNGLDDDGNGYVDDCYGINTINGTGNPMDDHGHGTHVAGIIGAVGNNGVGIAGINWQVSVMACKFLRSSGSGTLFDEVECLNYVKNMKQRGYNIVAVNASYGSYSSSSTEKYAIQELRNVGVLMVAAAGNESKNNDGRFKSYPCSYSTSLDNVICVAATDSGDNLASFSNYGVNTVHVGAPGVNILSTIPSSNYASWSGTSMATPHVAGLCALVKAKFPSYSYVNIKNAILNNVDQVPSLSNKVSTGGRINAYKSVSNGDSPPPPLGDLWGVFGSTSVRRSGAYLYITANVTIMHNLTSTINRRVYVDLYLSTNNSNSITSGDIKIGSRYVSSLGPGVYPTLRFSRYMTNPFGSTPVYLKAFVDSTNTISETDETNNITVIGPY